MRRLSSHCASGLRPRRLSSPRGTSSLSGHAPATASSTRDSSLATSGKYSECRRRVTLTGSLSLKLSQTTYLRIFRRKGVKRFRKLIRQLCKRGKTSGSQMRRRRRLSSRLTPPFESRKKRLRQPNVRSRKRRRIRRPRRLKRKRRRISLPTQTSRRWLAVIKKKMRNRRSQKARKRTRRSAKAKKKRKGEGPKLRQPASTTCTCKTTQMLTVPSSSGTTSP